MQLFQFSKQPCLLAVAVAIADQRQVKCRALSLILKDLFNANACWLVLIYDTLIISYVAKRIFKYVSYIL